MGKRLSLKGLLLCFCFSFLWHKFALEHEYIFFLYGLGCLEKWVFMGFVSLYRVGTQYNSFYSKSRYEIRTQVACGSIVVCCVAGVLNWHRKKLKKNLLIKTPRTQWDSNPGSLLASPVFYYGATLALETDFETALRLAWCRKRKRANMSTKAL